MDDYKKGQESLAQNTSASAFMERARNAQRQHGKLLRGRVKLPDPQKAAINTTAVELAGTFQTSGIDENLLIQLQTRFEGMCKRLGIPVPPELREDITHRLGLELWVNSKALTLTKRELVPVTAFSGAIAPKLQKDFPEYVEPAYVINHAVLHKPADPVGSLNRVRQTMQRLTTDESLDSIRKRMPGHLLSAAVQHSTDPESFLRKEYEKSLAASEKRRSEQSSSR